MIEKDELVAVLERMSRERFQRLSMDLLDNMGFETNTARSFGGDFEAEAELKRGETTLDYVIRITRSGGDPEKEVDGLKNALGPGVRGFYITTSEISKEVKTVDNIEVAGAQELYDLLKEYDLLADFDEHDDERSLPSASELNRLMDWASEFREKYNYPKAIEYYDKAIELKPDSYKPRVKKAEALIEKGEAYEAIDELKEFMEVGVEVPDVWLTMGKAYHEVGIYDEEIESYDRALDLDEDHVEAWNLKGSTLYEQGLYEEANLCFERILEVEPKDAGAWNNKGLCLFKLGDLPQALNSLNNALAIEPDYEDALINKALVLENQNKIPRALQVAHELTTLRPGKPEFHYIKAAYQEAVGDTEGALHSVESALRLKPDYERALKLKERLEKGHGEVPKEEPVKLDAEEIEYDRNYIIKKIHSLERDIGDLKSIKHTIDYKISTDDEVPGPTEEMEEKDEELDHLRGEKARLEKELSKIWQRRLEDEGREEDIEKLGKEKDILEKELEKREADLKEMEKTKEMLEEELRQLREGGEELSRQQEEDLVQAIKEREEKLELLVEDKGKMAEELQDSLGRIEELHDKIDSLEKEIEMHREEAKQRDEIIEDIKSKEELIDALSKEKDELQSKLEGSSSEIDRLKEERDLLQEEVDKLRQERERRELLRRETHQRMRRIREVEAKENLKFMRRAADLLFKMKENKKVIEMASDRGGDALLNILGCALYEMKQIGYAVNCFRDAPDPIGRYNQEEVSYEMGQYRNAANISEEIYLHFPNTSIYWERRGESYRKFGVLDKAISAYDKAVSIMGDEIDSFRLARARCTAERNGRVSAINELKKRMEEKDIPEGQNLLGALYYLERDYEKAITHFRKAAEVENGVHYNNLGCTAYQLERYGEALSALEKAVEAEPDNIAFINNLGFCQLERDLTEAARSNFKRVIEIDETDPVGWYNLGIVMKRLDEKDWNKHIEKALDLAPGFEEAKRILEL